MEREEMKAVITIVGRDQVGIVAMVSGILATNGVNVLNINQNILDGFFNMLMISDISNCKVTLKALQEILNEQGQARGLEIKVQHEDIFNIMHRI